MCWNGRLGAGEQPWTPHFCFLRITLLPGGILHITSVSRADVGTYRCMAHNVANTWHSQDAQLTLKQKPGESEWAPGREEGMGAGADGSRCGHRGCGWHRHCVCEALLSVRCSSAQTEHPPH